MSLVNREIDMAVWGCYYLNAVQHHQQQAGNVALQAFQHSHNIMVPDWRTSSSTKKRKLDYSSQAPSSSIGGTSSTNSVVVSSNVPSYKSAKLPKLHQQQQSQTSTSSSTISYTGTSSTPSSTIATSNISSTLTSSSSKSSSSPTQSSATAAVGANASGGDTSRLLFDRRGRGSVTFRPYTDSLLECSVLKANCLEEFRGGHFQSGGARNKRKPFLFGYVGCDGTLVGSYQNSNYYLPLAKNHPRGCMTFRNGDNRERVEVEKSYTQVVKTTIGNLFPEILSIIFEYLDVPSKGRAAQVSRRWRDAAYKKSCWKGVEAKLHLNKPNPNQVTSSLVKRGIKNVQVLSMRKGLKELVNGLTNMGSLNLSGCYNLSDSFMEGAFQAKKEYSSLKTLNLSLCKEVNDDTLGRIAQTTTNLEDLDLAGCSKITNGGLIFIGYGLKKLKRLNLRSCRQLTDHGIAHLAGIAQHPLSASIQATQENISQEQSNSIEDLCLQDCQKLTDESLNHLAQGLKSLQSLNLSFCVSVTDTGLKSLSKLDSLRSVNLRSCDNVSDIGIAFLSEENSGIENLDVSFCANVTNMGLKHISTGFSKLKCLSMTTCSINDEGLKKMSKNLLSLEELNIGQCVSITDDGLKSVCENMKSLKQIDLYGCTKVSSKAVSQIKKSIPSLKHLNLDL